MCVLPEPRGPTIVTHSPDAHSLASLARRVGQGILGGLLTGPIETRRLRVAGASPERGGTVGAELAVDGVEGVWAASTDIEYRPHKNQVHEDELAHRAARLEKTYDLCDVLVLLCRRHPRVRQRRRVGVHDNPDTLVAGDLADAAADRRIGELEPLPHLQTRR